MSLPNAKGGGVRRYCGKACCEAELRAAIDGAQHRINPLDHGWDEHPKTSARTGLPPNCTCNSAFAENCGLHCGRLVGKGFPPLEGRAFASLGDTLEAFKQLFAAHNAQAGNSAQATAAAAASLAWDGVPLYNNGVRAVADPRMCTEATSAKNFPPELPNFPPDDGLSWKCKDEGAFVAHLDAAGAERPYGAHPPTPLGSKLGAAAAELRRLRAGGHKAVVFSSSQQALEVLYEGMEHEKNGCVAMIAGTSSHAARTDALRRFRDEKEVAALLLPVRACAAGLTLTTADHVLLIDLQGHEAMELQLINRVHRIGQDKPVKVLRYIAEGTIEERMLHLRGTGQGLIGAAARADAEDEGDSLTFRPAVDVDDDAPAAGGKAKAAPAAVAARATAERHGDLRYLYGL